MTTYSVKSYSSWFFPLLTSVGGQQPTREIGFTSVYDFPVPQLNYDAQRKHRREGVMMFCAHFPHGRRFNCKLIEDMLPWQGGGAIMDECLASSVEVWMSQEELAEKLQDLDLHKIWTLGGEGGSGSLHFVNNRAGYGKIKQ